MEELQELRLDDIVVVNYGNNTREVRLGDLPRGHYGGFSIDVDTGCGLLVKISKGLLALMAMSREMTIFYLVSITIRTEESPL
jgi:hypothetical protein